MTKKVKEKGWKFCFDFRRSGKCHFGTKCAFKHIAPGEQIPDQPKCVPWTKGRCTFGTGCRFSHDGPGGCIPGGHVMSRGQTRAPPRSMGYRQDYFMVGQVG